MRSLLFRAHEAVRDSDLTGPQRGVYLALAARYNDKTGQCNPSLDTIATDSGYGRKTVTRAISVLVEKGWLEYTPGSQHRSNYYVPLIPEVSESPVSSVTESTSSVRESIQQGQSDTRTTKRTTKKNYQEELPSNDSALRATSWQEEPVEEGPSIAGLIEPSLVPLKVDPRIPCPVLVEDDFWGLVRDFSQ